MERVKINSCNIEDLLRIRGIGAATANRILALREAMGDITPRSLAQVPHIRNIEGLEELLDFTPAHGPAQAAAQARPNLRERGSPPPPPPIEPYPYDRFIPRHLRETASLPPRGVQNKPPQGRERQSSLPVDLNRPQSTSPPLLRRYDSLGAIGGNTGAQPNHFQFQPQGDRGERPIQPREGEVRDQRRVREEGGEHAHNLNQPRHSPQIEARTSAISEQPDPRPEGEAIHSQSRASSQGESANPPTSAQCNLQPQSGEAIRDTSRGGLEPPHNQLRDSPQREPLNYSTGGQRSPQPPPGRHLIPQREPLNFSTGGQRSPQPPPGRHPISNYMQILRRETANPNRTENYTKSNLYSRGEHNCEPTPTRQLRGYGDDRSGTESSAYYTGAHTRGQHLYRDHETYQFRYREAPLASQSREIHYTYEPPPTQNDAYHYTYHNSPPARQSRDNRYYYSEQPPFRHKAYEHTYEGPAPARQDAYEQIYRDPPPARQSREGRYAYRERSPARQSTESRYMGPDPQSSRSNYQIEDIPSIINNRSETRGLITDRDIRQTTYDCQSRPLLTNNTVEQMQRADGHQGEQRQVMGPRFERRQPMNDYQWEPLQSSNDCTSNTTGNQAPWHSDHGRVKGGNRYEQYTQNSSPLRSPAAQKLSPRPPPALRQTLGVGVLRDSSQHHALPSKAPEVSRLTQQPTRTSTTGRSPPPLQRLTPQTLPANRSAQRVSSGPLLPRTITFNGTGSWQAFLAKFNTFAKKYNWDAEERQDQLCWCLEGKASEYYASLIKRDPDIEYREAMSKLETRFAPQELPEVAHMHFNYARQAPAETCMEWADRLLTLATQAFSNLPEDYVQRQLVLRFCQGSSDREAGQHTLNCQPPTLDQAIRITRMFQHTRQAMFGKSRKDIKQVAAQLDETRDGRDIDIRKVGSPHLPQPSPRRPDHTLETRVTQLEEKLDSFQNSSKGQLDSVEAQVRALQSLVQGLATTLQGRKDFPRPRPSPGRSSPARIRLRSPGPDNPCFRCGKFDHFRRDCPGVPEKTVSFVDTVEENYNGSEEGAQPRPN